MKLCASHKIKTIFPSLVQNCVPKFHTCEFGLLINPHSLQLKRLTSSFFPCGQLIFVTSKDKLRGGHRRLSTYHAKFALNQTFGGQPQSWLFVSKAVAGAYGAQVNLDIDVDGRLAADSLPLLQENIKARGISFDLKNLESLFKQFKTIQLTQKVLGERKLEILKLLKKGQDKCVGDSLIADLRQNKKEIKCLAKELWDIEERLMLTALQLPNELHSSTPLKQMEVKRDSNVLKGDRSELTHIEIARKYDLIKFSNVGPKAYYLKAKLARTEMILTDVAHNFFHRHGFRLMSGPEFFKTPIMEGCGQDVYDTDKVLTIQHTSQDIEPMLHLAGVSPMTFAAYVAKLSIGSSSLPMRMFSIGRRYQKGTLPGLLGASQTTQVGLFSCVSQKQIDSEFDHLVETVWNFLEPFGFAIRLYQVSAKELLKEERRKIEIQVFVPSLNNFVPLAWISDLGDFVSRRLMTVHNDNHGDIRHGQLVHMISGTALNITSLLAVWIEESYNGSDKFILRELPPLGDWRR